MTFTSINVPGGTFDTPTAINDVGQIAGSFIDSSGNTHGFIDSGGAFTTIDVAGATSTSISSINNTGQVVGTYVLAGVTHGFLDSGGTITTLDPAGSTGTTPTAINASGQIVGYFTANAQTHGFLDVGGVFTTIDVNGVGSTKATAINASGQIAGSNGSDGFIDTAGVITLIDGPGSLSHGTLQPSPTTATAINAAGQVAGTYTITTTANGTTAYQYSAGTLTSFGGVLAVTGIGGSGQIIGAKQGTFGGSQGFVSSNGTLSTITIPGGAMSSFPEAIDTAGDIVGYYFDTNQVEHGFVTTACFAAGTRILTEQGDVPIENLRVGDRVPALRSGTLLPVVWLGHRTVRCDLHPKPQSVWPIRVSANAIADGVPCRNLWLSPEHAVFVEGVLVPVRLLINGATIVQQPRKAVTYWHVELPVHDLILSESMPTESYLDTGNRSDFANGGPVIKSHPDFANEQWNARACFPQVRHGARLTAIHDGLVRRAVALGSFYTANQGNGQRCLTRNP